MPKMIAVEELTAMLQSAQNGLTMLHEEPRFAHMASDIAAEITAINEIRKMIERMDAVDAKPVRHAKWVKTWDNTYLCSKCRAEAPNEGYDRSAKYCNECGATMDVEERAT